MQHHHHSGDQHSHSNTNNRNILLTALILTSCFMLVEVVGGLLSGSLALIADAGHMLTDAGALLLAFSAVSWSNKPADKKRTFGYARLQVLAAFTNGIALIALTIWIIVEAVGRFQNPQPIESLAMFMVALIGLVVNLLVFKLLHGASEGNINIRGAMLHVMGDLLGSVGAIIAAIMIYFRGWLWADPILSVLVSLLILKSAWRLIKESAHILLEGSPGDLDIEAIKRSLVALDKVDNIHHVHLWCLNEQKTMISLHANIAPSQTPDMILGSIKEVLREQYNIEHATIQIEQQLCAEINCE
jgi:cobalt-zinc-cadmium efflux system protein